MDLASPVAARLYRIGGRPRYSGIRQDCMIEACVDRGEKKDICGMGLFPAFRILDMILGGYRRMEGSSWIPQ